MRRLSFRLFAIVLLAVFLTTTASQGYAAKRQNTQLAPKSEPRVALVIGNGQYLGRILKNPENDAELVANTLTSLGFEVELYTNLDQKEMLQRVFDFFHHKAVKSPLRVIYYAGHGVQYDNHNYLIPVDANLSIPSEIPNNSFMLDELRRNLDALQQGANIIILDTCRVTLCPVGRCRNPMSSLGISNEPSSSGTLIAYSTGPGNPASDGQEAVHSLYTQLLVELLPTPGLPVEAIFRQLTEAVYKRSGGQQKPEFMNGLMGESICFSSASIGKC